MGAGASLSADDKAELKKAYAEWSKQESPIDDAAFIELLRNTAPGLHAKAVAEGTGPAAAAALKSQFETAKRKLKMQAASSSDDNDAAESDLPPPLQKLVSWAPDRATNLQRGLAANLLRSECAALPPVPALLRHPQVSLAASSDAARVRCHCRPLRLVDIAIGSVKVAALLDTGAEHCAMSAVGATRCGLQPLVDSSFGGVAGGIGTTAKQGRVHYAKVELVGASSSSDVGGAGVATALASTADAPVAPPAATTAVAMPTTPKSDGARAPAEASSKPLFEVAFDVMTWPPHVSFDAILGIDFLARHKALIDVCCNKLRLTTQSSEEIVQVTLRLDGT